MRSSKVFYGWWIVAGCFILTCSLIPLLMALYNKFLLQVTGEMQISRSAFTLSSAITQVLGIFLSPFVARILNAGNFRLRMSLGVIGFSLSYASYSLAQNVWHLYISAFFVGVFFVGTTLIPLSMLVTNWFVKKRGLALSVVMAGIGLGGFVFSPLVTWLMANYGWRATYQIMALIILVLVLPVTALVLRRRPEDMGLTAYGAGEAADSTQIKKGGSGVALSVKASYAKGFFWVLIISAVTNGLINTGALGQFPPAIEEKFGPMFQATIISLYSVIGIFGKLAMGWVNDRFGIVASSIYGGATVGGAFLCILLATTPAGIYLMAVLFGLGLAIGSMSMPLLTAAIYGQENYGEAYGVVNSAFQAGLSLGSILVAGIFDLTGSYTLGWILMLILTAVTLAGWIGSYAMSRRYAAIRG